MNFTTFFTYFKTNINCCTQAPASIAETEPPVTHSDTDIHMEYRHHSDTSNEVKPCKLLHQM